MKQALFAKYHLHKEQPEKLQFEIYNLQDFLRKNKEHTTIPHSHSFYQILWFFEAGGNHSIDFETYPIKENTLFFISKDQIHYFDEKTDYKGVLIHFNESFLMQSDVDVFLKYNIFNNPIKPCFNIVGETVDQTLSYIGLIKNELDNKIELGHKQVIRYLLKSLLIVLERIQSDKKEVDIRLTSQYDLQYLHFRELIEENFKKAYNVSDYASLLNVSAKTLATITKFVTSKSPSSIISERIILEAERLLSFTPLKINEIAYALGFEDASYFVKFFKRHLRKSPSDYRKSLNDYNFFVDAN